MTILLENETAAPLATRYWAEGKSMTMEQAVEYALREIYRTRSQIALF